MPFQSRLAVLSTKEGERRFDYGLTTAHSLVGQAECRVSDNKGHGRRVIGFRISPDYPSNDPYNAHADWAVIKFKRMRTKGLVRFTLSDDLSGADTVTTAFLPKGRGVLVNTKPCRIGFREARIPPIGTPFELPTHDCSTMKGQSGTPLIYHHNASSDLLGIHSGRSFLWPQNIGKGPKWYGRFVWLNTPTIDKINTAINGLVTD